MAETNSSLMKKERDMLQAFVSQLGDIPTGFNYKGLAEKTGYSGAKSCKVAFKRVWDKVHDGGASEATGEALSNSEVTSDADELPVDAEAAPPATPEKEAPKKKSTPKKAATSKKGVGAEKKPRKVSVSDKPKQPKKTKAMKDAEAAAKVKADEEAATAALAAEEMETDGGDDKEDDAEEKDEEMVVSGDEGEKAT